MIKQLGAIVIGLLVLSSIHSYPVTSRDTNMDVMGNGKSLYGEKISGLDVQCIGVNSSGIVAIDTDAVGTTFGGAVTSTGLSTASGALSVGTFLKVINATTCSPSAATAATITPVGTRQVIAGAAAISTVNTVATASITTGTIVIFKTNDSTKDVVFTEVGNCILGATTRTLNDVADRLALMYDLVTNRWCELFFVDNN